MDGFKFGNLEFRVNDGRVFIAECGSVSVPEDSYELGAFTEIQIAGENKDTHYGNKMICSSEGNTLLYDGHEIKGDTLFVAQKNGKIRVVTAFTVYGDTSAVRINTSVTNVSEEEIILEEVSAFVLGHVGLLTETQDIYYHRFTQSHHAECQPRVSSLFEEGLFKANPISQKRVGCCNVGSWSTKEELPQGVIERRKEKDFIMFQIESNNSWYYEISDYINRIYLYLGGANANLSGWVKRLKKGETYTTVNVALAFGNSMNEVIGDMTKYRRHIAGHCAADDNLPVIFNEYMHLSWDGPDWQKTREYAKSAKDAGAEYYVVDCGWHDEVDPRVIYLYMGAWKQSKKRFPLGVKETADYVHSLGLKFGLWIEPEIVGIKCEEMLSYYTDDCFLQRNGKRLAIMNRHFLDYRSEKVRGYMTETIRRMVEDYGADYIKLDYNQDCGVGTDYSADGAGEGLEQAAAAFLKWIEEIRAAFPNVLFENCSSGGMRIDYKTMSYFSIASTSDQTDYRLYPYIAANILSGVLPEQAAVWSYPVGTSVYPESNPFKADAEWIENNVDERQIVMNMVNASLGRMHLASHIELLSENKRALVKEGVAFYNSLTEFKKKALPYFPLGFADFRSEFVSCGLMEGNRLVLAAWLLGGKTERSLPLPLEAEEIKIAYPSKSAVKFHSNGRSLEINFGGVYDSCVFDIKLKK